jgi:hypothetical protein
VALGVKLLCASLNEARRWSSRRGMSKVSVPWSIKYCARAARRLRSRRRRGVWAGHSHRGSSSSCLWTNRHLGPSCFDLAIGHLRANNTHDREPEVPSGFLIESSAAEVPPPPGRVAVVVQTASAQRCASRVQVCARSDGHHPSAMPRQDCRRAVTMSLDKGLTRARAKVSALMESLDGFYAEEIRLLLVRDTDRQSRFQRSQRPSCSCDRLLAMTGTT